jgi:hypothetical protein
MYLPVHPVAAMLPVFPLVLKVRAAQEILRGPN